MISRENARNVTVKGRFTCAVCRNGVNKIAILSQFCSCWVHKRCSGMTDKLKEHSKFKCLKCANQQTLLETDIAKDFTAIWLNSQSFKIVRKFVYLGDTIRATAAAEKAIKSIWSGWSKLRVLAPLLRSTILPKGAKDSIFSTYT